VARGRLKGKDITGKSIVAPRTDPNLKDLLGPNAKNWAARAHAIAAIPEPKRRTYITEIKDEGRTITSEVLLSVDRASRKETVRQTIVKGKFSKDGPFGTVILDPPWPMQKMERRTFTNSAEFEYPVMAVEDITALLKKDIVPKLEKDCHMFMWTTEKFLPVAIAMVGELGFEYVLTMVWHKNGGVQPFGLPQFNCEFVVYARRGTPRFVDFKNFMCCFEAKRREPGRKPDEFAATIRRVTGGSRLVVFARTSPEGFACYGNEVDKFKTE
jgi:N6-adenosine-specific RNA methylase IME4